MIKKDRKRLGIFIFYDRDNIVDDYVLYLLNDICSNFSHLTIISNSQLQETEKQKLEKFSEDIIIRENAGLDAGALYSYFNSNQDYQNYDEVVCFNDTFFGPLYSFKNVFDEMDQRDVDFWGLALGHRQRDGYGIMKEGYIPEHIQTFFIAFRKKVLLSDAFINYWKNYDYENMQTFYDVVTKHELRFTKYLHENGFSYDSYIKDTNASENFKENYNNYNYNSSTQIIQDHALYLKRKNFVTSKKDFLYLTDSNDLNVSYEYIKNHTNYDVGLIWKNILRLYNLSDIHETFGLYSIIQNDEIEKKESLAYIIYIDNILMQESLAKKIEELKETVYIFTSKKEIYDFLKEKKLNVEKIKKNTFFKKYISLINQIKEKYVGFMFIEEHEENTINIIEETVYNNYINGIMKNTSYVSNMLNVFTKEKNLGILYVPNNMHYDYFYKNIHWEIPVFEKIKELLPQYKMFQLEKTPISFSNAWIARKEILTKIDYENWNISEDEFFSKCLTIYISYFGAINSFYPNVVLDINEAKNQLTNLMCVYKNTYQKIQEIKNIPLTFIEELNYIEELKKQYKEKKYRKIGRRIKQKIRRIIK